MGNREQYRTEDKPRNNRLWLDRLAQLYEDETTEIDTEPLHFSYREKNQTPSKVLNGESIHIPDKEIREEAEIALKESVANREMNRLTTDGEEVVSGLGAAKLEESKKTHSSVNYSFKS